MSSFLTYLVVNAVALYAASRLVSGIRVDVPAGLVLGALALGLVNTFVRPVMQVLSLPLTLLSLGLFYFVVNGLTFGLAAAFVPGFSVDGLWPAILGAIVVGFVSWVVGGATKGLVPKE